MHRLRCSGIFVFTMKMHTQKHYNYLFYAIEYYVFRKSKKEIWIGPITKVHIPTENAKKTQNGNTKATKNVDYTTITDRLTAGRWINYSCRTTVVKPVFGHQISN